MPILDNEIVWRPAALMSDVTPAQNGGRMAFSQLVSGVKNNLFPDVSQSERLAGAVKWRKAFIHVNSAQDTALLNVRLFLDSLTPGGDFVVFQPGTQTDTEDQIVGRPYGIGTLYAPIVGGAVQIQVACEHNAEYASADYAPLNPATGTPYFTIKAIAWAGTFQTNDTVTFVTQPAAIPIWYRRQVPAATFSLANDFTSLAIHGESA